MKSSNQGQARGHGSSGARREDARSVRIRELTAAVRDGSYRPDPAVTAARMIAAGVLDR